jgi:uncharacterized protein YxjI
MRYYLNKRFLTIKSDFVILKNGPKNDIAWDIKGSFLRIFIRFLGDYFRVYDRSGRQEIFSIKQRVFQFNAIQYTVSQNCIQTASIQRNRSDSQPDVDPDTPLVEPTFLEIFCANGTALQFRGDFKRNNFEIVNEFAPTTASSRYGTIRRETTFLRNLLGRSMYAVDVADGVDDIYTHIVIAAAIVLDRQWKHGIRMKTNDNTV